MRAYVLWCGANPSGVCLLNMCMCVHPYMICVYMYVHTVCHREREKERDCKREGEIERD